MDDNVVMPRDLCTINANNLMCYAKYKIKIFLITKILKIKVCYIKYIFLILKEQKKNCRRNFHRNANFKNYLRYRNEYFQRLCDNQIVAVVEMKSVAVAVAVVVAEWFEVLVCV